MGIGSGVSDRLRELGIRHSAVNVGTTSRKPEKYKNLRAELCEGFKEWLKEGTIEGEYQEDCCGIQYSYDSAGRLVMERKEDMKRRGLASPDMMDSAMLCFYPPQNILSQERKNMRALSRVRSTGWTSEVGIG